MKNFRRFMMASALAVCGVASMQAQQVNGDFNQPWVANTPWDSKNGYYTGVDFTQPAGWVVSNVSGISGLGATSVATREEVGADDYAVVIANSPNSLMSSQIIPGYMSLGTTWATAVSKISTVSDADGGSCYVADLLLNTIDGELCAVLAVPCGSVGIYQIEMNFSINIKT